MKPFFFTVFLLAASVGFAKTVHYDLVLRQETVALSGRGNADFALTVNGGIPGPTLEFTEGDDAEITVTNQVPTGEDVSIHWHGILLPPLEDGVPYVNTPPIFRGQSRTFKFRLRQHGTYWYHSHTMLQEQKGVYGALVIHPRAHEHHPVKDVVAMLNDWSDENADDIVKNLKKDGDYYLFKKDSIRSYGDALRQGKLGVQLSNEWARMGGMDPSDVGYDAFLINGRRESQLATLRPGEQIRLRLINGSSSTHMRVSLGGLPMTVIAADGTDIEPLQAKELFMGMAETYDVLFALPDAKNYELRTSAVDGTGHASAWIGVPQSEKVAARAVPAPELFMAMNHDMSTHDMQGMDHAPMTADGSEHEGHESEPMVMEGHMHGHASAPPSPSPGIVIESLTVDDLKALRPTTLPPAPVKELTLTLDGDMRRYVWTIDGRIMSEDPEILVEPKQVVRLTYRNNSMMHHPMHLHGHFFRVLNKNGDRSPIKHTVDVPPMGSRTIEFFTDEPGQWMLHCHNLFHMGTGMSRIVKYTNFTPPHDLADHASMDHHMQDPWFTMARIEASTSFARADLRVSRSRDQFEARAEGRTEGVPHFSLVNASWRGEGDLFYRRWLGSWTSLVAGGSADGDERFGVVGAGLILPMLIETNWLAQGNGRFRLDVQRSFQWTKTLVSDFDLTWRPGEKESRETETTLSLMYAPQWHWAAGLILADETVSAGFMARF